MARNETARKIVGLSLSPKLAAEFKAEAARRNVSLKALFEELWAAYKTSKKA